MRERKQEFVNDFRGRRLPEPAWPCGYAALIQRYDLQVPSPSLLAAITGRSHRTATAEWQLFTQRHAPEDTLGGHLEFALKWEGVDLSVLNSLFRAVRPEEVAEIVRATPTGAYSRRLWYLYEWLTDRTLDLPDAPKVAAAPVVDPKRQFALTQGHRSSRHKVSDNLPGTREFCPMVRRTLTLDQYATKALHQTAQEVLGRTRADILQRTAAFLLLKDSRSSFTIEGERPSSQRAARWGQAIGEAGSHPLSVEELERLQRVVIGDSRLVHLGLRTEGGFVGEHDRELREPLPDHVSARPEDLRSLVKGIVAYGDRAIPGGVDPVVAAAAIAFGFVYVHPFEDGNGRLHRWLIHHVLATAGYNPSGIVFPVSVAILREIDAYRRVLESYSRPLLPFIQWEPTDEGNVHVLNDTADYYRFFDATAHAEFLYRCVEQTVERDVPEEVAYLEAYDQFSRRAQEVIDMPDRTVDLLHRFLRSGEGQLSKRARDKEFSALGDDEVRQLERVHAECFRGVTRAESDAATLD